MDRTRGIAKTHGLLLGVWLAATASASPLELGFDPETQVGTLSMRDGAVELTRRSGWVPEDSAPVDLRGAAGTLVFWRTFPRRQYLAPELWVHEEGSARRVWPAEGETLSLYQGRARVHEVRGRPAVDLVSALVDENFTPPLLQRLERWVLGAHGARRVDARVEEPETSDQLLNRVADHLARGERAAAEVLAERLEDASPEVRERRVLLFARYSAAPEERAARRESLAALADRGAGDASRAAADQLLRWTQEDAGIDSKGHDHDQ